MAECSTDALPSYVADQDPPAPAPSREPGGAQRPAAQPHGLATMSRVAHELSERLASASAAAATASLPPSSGYPDAGGGGSVHAGAAVVHLARHLLIAPDRAADAFDRWRAGTAGRVKTRHGALRLVGEGRATAPQLRILSARLELPLSPFAVPVELELVAWGRWRTILAMRPARRLGSMGRATPPDPLLRRRPRHHGRRHRPTLCARIGRGAGAALVRPTPVPWRRMRALVVYAHPSDDSLSHTLFEVAVTALAAAGAEVATVDLYAEDFVAAMSASERTAYHSDAPIQSDAVARHAEAVRWADTLVFVYPTWWMGCPAILKGWLERVLVPGVAFHLDERTHRVVSDLGHIRRVVGITTYGAAWPTVKLMNDAGRRTLLRALRMLCARRCRTTWLALYSVDARTPEDRARFVAKVDHRLRAAGARR